MKTSIYLPDDLAGRVRAYGIKIDTEEPYWDGFQAGAGDVWDAVEPLLHRPMR